MKPHERANAYLAIPPRFAEQLGGLRWSFTHDGILDSDGQTFVLVEELAQILDGVFARPPVPPFAYVLAALRLLSQCTNDSRVGTGDAYKKHRSAVGFPRNVGLLIAELCRELPAAVAPPESNEVRLALDDRLRFGRQSMPGLVADSWLVFDEVERTLATALFKIEPDSLVSWLRTGAPSNADAAEKLAEPVETLSVRIGKLFELANARPRLVGAAWLTPALDAALAFPPRRRSADAIPQGGHADVTTRGRPEQLLLSQFSLDSDEFVRRFAEKELLYFKPEEPHAPQPPDRVIVLDQGVRTWGHVRLALAGAALSLLRKHGKGFGPAYLVHSPDRNPISLDKMSPDELAEILETSDLTDSPADTLANAVVSAGDRERPRDLFLLTHPRSMLEPGVILAINARRETDRVFALTVDAAGHAEIGEWGQRGPVRLRSFRVDLAGAEAIRVNEAREVRPPKLGRALAPWTGDVEPIGFPFRPGLVAEPAVFGFDGSGEWLVAASRDGIVQAITLDGEPPEVLPRAYRDGSVLKSVEAIFGTNDGVAVCGRMMLDDESSFVRVVTSTVSGIEPAVISSATKFNPPSRSEWYVVAHYSQKLRVLAIHRLAKATGTILWFVSKDRREVGIRSIPAYIPELNVGVYLETGKRTQRDRSPEWTSRTDAPPYRLPVWTKWSTEESFRCVPYLYLENQSFEVRLVSPSWPKHEPMREGKPLLGGTIVEGAQLANDVLVLSTYCNGNRERLVFRSPDARLVFQLPNKWGSGSTLSPDGGLLAYKGRVSDVSIVETISAARPRTVATTARLHNGLSVKFDESPCVLWISVGGFIHQFSFDSSAMVHSIQRGKSLSRGGIPSSSFVDYDPSRFPLKAQNGFDVFRAVVDRLGQVLLMEKSRILVSFLIRRDKAAAICSDGTSWGDPILLGYPATPQAAVKIKNWLDHHGGTSP
ncbi:MAG: hypothetical protein KF873_20700 [Gemmataceae bacterium]|nr:hypothetical protein [Gemmataceae bacterium]